MFIHYIGSPRQQVHRQLCTLVSDTRLGDILNSVTDGDQCEELYRRYLHDFVRSVHKCTHNREQTKANEYKVCQPLIDFRDTVYVMCIMHCS